MTVELFEELGSPPCAAVKVLAKLIGLDLTLTRISLAEGAHRTPDFTKKSPFQTVPAINDNGFILNESRAILVYLVCKYAPESDLYPKDLQKRGQVDAMLNYDVGNLAAGLWMRMEAYAKTGKDSSDIVLQRGKDQLNCLNNLLSTRKYAAGDHLTLADISIIHTLSVVEAFGDDISSFVHLVEYMKRVKAALGDAFQAGGDADGKVLQMYIDSIRK